MEVFWKSLAVPLAGLAVGFGLTWAAAAPKKKAAAKTTTAKSVKKTTPAKSAPSKSAAARKTRPQSRSRSTAYSRSRARGRSPQPVAARRYRGQQAPTAERNIEIQQALASRGYLHSEPSGTWSANATEALKRFQEDQNLPPTGKITSLSLIALGLGPKRNAITAGVQAPTVP